MPPKPSAPDPLVPAPDDEFIPDRDQVLTLMEPRGGVLSGRARARQTQFGTIKKASRAEGLCVGEFGLVISSSALAGSDKNLILIFLLKDLD
ncbi:hypothetical protein KSP40_PGU011701 [Platanthera guangdongensis]|uniref:Uncharacterized protein n=1 Tax=Platanthera guangdongensis TaxID=2320717 RepID=A0ABR2LDL7_9ASPA